MWVFVGIVKGGAELKIFHYMLNYNDTFVAPNNYGNVIVFMEDPLSERRLWVSKIPW